MNDRSFDIDMSPKPDVPRQAVALAAGPNVDATRLVAKGYGDVAESIIARAKEHGLVVHDDPELVRLLSRIDLDASIPIALYQVVAELLGWLYDLEHRR